MRRNRPIVFFFCISSLFNMACSFAHPVTPVLFKQLGLQDYMFGVALACMSFGNLLFSPFWGRMCSRLSSRVVMLICCMGYCVGQLLFVNAQSMLQVVCIRFCTGIFIGGVFVGLLTYVVNTAPDESIRARWLVTQATVEAVSSAIGYFVGGMLGEISVRTSVLTQACTLAFCGLMFVLLCQSDRKTDIAPIQARTFLREVNPFRAFAQGKPILFCAMGFLMAVCALQHFNQTCFDQSFNYYAIDQLKLSTGYSGAIKGSMGLVTLLANSTLCVWLMKHTPIKRSVAIVFGLCSAMMALAILQTTLVPFIVLSIVFYALNAISVPMLRNLAASAGRERGLDGGMVMSFYNALKNLGGILGALLAGFTYMASPKTPFICCVISTFAAAAIALVYRRKTSSQNAANHV